MRLLGLGEYAEGEHELPEVALPDERCLVSVIVQACTSLTPDIWPDEHVSIELRMVASDDGREWIAAGACTAVGGIHRRRTDGAELAVRALHVRYPAGPGKRVKGVLQVTGGTLHSAVDLTVMPL